MITPDEIVNRKIGKAFFGYDEQEVDYFLDEIIIDLIRRDEQIDELRAKLRHMEDKEKSRTYEIAAGENTGSSPETVQPQEDELSAMVDESLAQNSVLEYLEPSRDMRRYVRELGLYFD